MTVFDYLFYGVIGSFCLFNFWYFWRSCRLYRHDWRAGIGLTRRAAARSNNFIIEIVKAALIVVMAVLLSRWMGVYSTKLNTMIAGALFSMTLQYLRPPIALVLASSQSNTVRQTASSIRNYSRGHRVIYFLKLSETEDETVFNQGFGSAGKSDNLYQFDGNAWKFAVYPILKVVPVIVMDAGSASSGLADEIEFIRSDPSLLKKMVVFCNPTAASDIFGAAFDVATSRSELDCKIRSIIERTLNPGNLKDNLNHGRCSICGKPMIMLAFSCVQKDLFQKVLGSFRCISCHRLTCWDCSDSRKKCRCGAMSWREELYLDPHDVDQ